MHLSERILESIKKKLMNMPFAGHNVFRSRTEELQLEEIPAVTIMQGDDRVLRDKKHIKYYDCNLSVHIALYARNDHWQHTESLINKLRAEVSRRLHADYTLGLDYIIEMQEIITEKPVISSASESFIVKTHMIFEYQYRRLRNDPEKNHAGA